jgi:hypothetical protein
MKSWKQILSCMVAFLTVLSLSVSAQAPKAVEAKAADAKDAAKVEAAKVGAKVEAAKAEAKVEAAKAGDVKAEVKVEAAKGGDAKGGGLTPEERAALAKDSAPLTAKAIAQYVELKGDAEKKFTDAYLAESEAAQKRAADARQASSGDRQGMMEVMRTNGEKMKEVMDKNLTPEQATKAAKVAGPFNSLDREIQNLLRNKVEKEKVEKALPALLKYAEASQELMAKMRDGGVTREEIGTKVTDLRAAAAKDLAPAIGEEAANKWKETRGFGGMRGGGPRPAQQ